MFRFGSRITVTALALTLAAIIVMSPAPAINAADHAESTSVAGDPGADLADVFAFLDPTNNTRVVLAMDVEGFIVPSELANLSFFAPDVMYRFEIENTGDAIADQNVDITFSPQTSRTAPQTATIRLPNGRTFSAPTTVQTLAATANPFSVTTDATSGATFFAGLTDDPFYFDIVGFNRFLASVLAGTPDVTRLARNRDSFSGYNIHMIAISVPATLLKGAGNIIGVNGVTMRQKKAIRKSSGDVAVSGKFFQVDRMATPAVNTVLIPFPRKNEYNAASPPDDAAGLFAADIVATLRAVGTNQANINILAGVAVTTGDYLRLNLALANASLGEGENLTSPGYTGFPNGRRPGDDVVNTLIFLITNQSSIREAVNRNDVALPTAFPFFAPPNQPLENPAVDNTKN